METILHNIEERLRTLVTDLKYVAEDWGQLSLYSDAPVRYPCALIDFGSSSWGNEGNLVQQGNANLNIVVADWQQQVSSRAPMTMRNRHKSIYPLLRQIYVALQGWRPAAHAGAMIRTNLTRQVREDGLRYFIITFSIGIQDNSAKSIPKAPVNNITIRVD